MDWQPNKIVEDKVNVEYQLKTSIQLTYQFPWRSTWKLNLLKENFFVMNVELLWLHLMARLEVMSFMESTSMTYQIMGRGEIMIWTVKL